jgi:hypothetical protein
MNVRRNRRLSGVIGAFLILLAVGVVTLVGTDLVSEPLLLAQAALLGVAGVCDIVAATDTALTERWGWYQWSGLGNILLGFALPLAFVGSGEQLFILGVTAIGGLSLAAMGLDMVAFHGKYTRGERLDQER